MKWLIKRTIIEMKNYSIPSIFLYWTSNILFLVFVITYVSAVLLLVLDRSVNSSRFLGDFVITGEGVSAAAILKIFCPTSDDFLGLSSGSPPRHRQGIEGQRTDLLIDSTNGKELDFLTAFLLLLGNLTFRFISTSNDCPVAWSVNLTLSLTVYVMSSDFLSFLTNCLRVPLKLVSLHLEGNFNCKSTSLIGKGLPFSSVKVTWTSSWFKCTSIVSSDADFCSLLGLQMKLFKAHVLTSKLQKLTFHGCCLGLYWLGVGSNHRCHWHLWYLFQQWFWPLLHLPRLPQ